MVAPIAAHDDLTHNGDVTSHTAKHLEFFMILVWVGGWENWTHRIESSRDGNVRVSPY